MSPACSDRYRVGAGWGSRPWPSTGDVDESTTIRESKADALLSTALARADEGPALEELLGPRRCCGIVAARHKDGPDGRYVESRFPKPMIFRVELTFRHGTYHQWTRTHRPRRRSVPGRRGDSSSMRGTNVVRPIIEPIHRGIRFTEPRQSDRIVKTSVVPRTPSTAVRGSRRYSCQRGTS